MSSSILRLSSETCMDGKIKGVDIDKRRRIQFSRIQYEQTLEVNVCMAFTVTKISLPRNLTLPIAQSTRKKELSRQRFICAKFTKKNWIVWKKFYFCFLFSFSAVCRNDRGDLINFFPILSLQMLLICLLFFVAIPNFFSLCLFCRLFYFSQLPFLLLRTHNFSPLLFSHCNNSHHKVSKYLCINIERNEKNAGRRKKEWIENERNFPKDIHKKLERLEKQEVKNEISSLSAHVYGHYRRPT